MTSRQINEFLAKCSKEQRRAIFDILRNEFHIHPIEKKLNAKAHVILEAIARAPDLTLRGIRGIIAEAAFLASVLPKHVSLKDVTPVGTHAYDFAVHDGSGPVRIQVKMQRQVAHQPMIRHGMFVCETQRTRGGKDEEGNDTRPYTFDEFDVLAVALHPSSGNWEDFRYTPAWNLASRKGNPHQMEKLQPVPQKPNEKWTDDLGVCLVWFRKGR